LFLIFLYCSVPLRSWSLLFTNRVVSNLFVLLCSVCALNHHWFAMNLLIQSQSISSSKRMSPRNVFFCPNRPEIARRKNVTISTFGSKQKM
jgi:hypothetical protein